MSEVRHLSAAELESGLHNILSAPKDNGALTMICARPDVDARETPVEARLDTEVGLVGDNWSTRKKVHPEMQLNIMGSRVVELVAADRDRESLAGDQLFLDLDLSQENLPPGTRLALGEAVIEVTKPPHTGCRKFAARFGEDALTFVNSRREEGLRLRGICAVVIESGDIKVGDLARKIS
ncbi:MAG: MOSC domain-containing protein [Pseudomonadota bacterium]